MTEKDVTMRTRLIIFLVGFILIHFEAIALNAFGTEQDPAAVMPGLASPGSLAEDNQAQAGFVSYRGGDVLFEGQSEYSRIWILQNGNKRCMVFGEQSDTTQTCINMARPDESIFEYTAMMFIGFLFEPESKKVCLIGVGGGYIPTVFRMHLPGHKLYMVELDPMVCSLAKKYLGFKLTPNQILTIDDGRRYLEKTRESFDQIMLDAFDSDYVPAHMSTREFLNVCKSKLSRKGVIIQNAHMDHRLFKDQLATYRHVFKHVYVFEGRRSGNAVIVAADSPTCRPPEFCGKKNSFRIGSIDLAEESKKISDPGILGQTRILMDPVKTPAARRPPGTF